MGPPTPQSPSYSLPNHNSLYKPNVRENPANLDMSLTERQQMHLDTESATHARMAGQSRSSHRYLLLQVWCGALTVAMVVMAVLFTSIKPKSTEDEVSTLRPDHVNLTGNTFVASLKSTGSSLSYIQLTKPSENHSWQNSPACRSCSLFLRNDSIHCKETHLYFIYAQVTFSKHPKKNQTRSVILKRNATFGRSMKKLVEGTFPHTAEGSLWVAKIVSLTEGDSVSINISDVFLTESTFWGAYQLQ